LPAGEICFTIKNTKLGVKGYYAIDAKILNAKALLGCLYKYAENGLSES